MQYKVNIYIYFFSHRDKVGYYLKPGISFAIILKLFFSLMLIFIFIIT